MNTELRNQCKKLPSWHPLNKYFEENDILIRTIEDYKLINPSEDLQAFINLTNKLSTIEIRYTRKENQLFPFLEAKGWTGPSQGMWTFHDSIRTLLRDIKNLLSVKEFSSLEHKKEILIEDLSRMIHVEEYRLFPYALELLQEEDWEKMHSGEEEIGFAFGISNTKDKNNEENINSVQHTLSNKIPNILNMNEGFLTLDQINLMLKFLPIDLTYVDENDRVIFYNRGEERVFPRSAGVIGREVKFCHPPKSVSTVLKILEEFKKGTKDDAEFWIDYRGKKIHIRYFAIRNNLNEYKGVIEVSQDITNILKITGEKRLLDWEM